VVVPALPIRLYRSWIFGLAVGHGLCSAVSQTPAPISSLLAVHLARSSLASKHDSLAASEPVNRFNFATELSLLVVPNTSYLLLQFIGQVAFPAISVPGISAADEAKVKFIHFVRFLGGGYPVLFLSYRIKKLKSY
jgi:hypothetical protein